MGLGWPSDWTLFPSRPRNGSWLPLPNLAVLPRHLACLLIPKCQGCWMEKVGRVSKETGSNLHGQGMLAGSGIWEWDG